MAYTHRPLRVDESTIALPRRLLRTLLSIVHSRGVVESQLTGVGWRLDQVRMNSVRPASSLRPWRVYMRAPVGTPAVARLVRETE